MIRVENISKQYRIGAKSQAARTLGEAVSNFLLSPVRNFKGLRGLTTFRKVEEDDVIWALKDISFEVKTGEVVGIIGRNGAGKSTLLKVLSRITPPSSGRVSIEGRVSSLLEVGTGFHPELTGRENIYLNGTILGMRKTEVERKFDEIVEFSGIEKFIDTPVKRYSSGMTVRLAFAVAAHLEPEVLIIDEVLAVGDSAFQTKCIGKMQDLSSERNRTIIFVSHNMSAVENLCSRAIRLEKGRIVKSGKTNDVIRSYMEGVNSEVVVSSGVWNGVSISCSFEVGGVKSNVVAQDHDMIIVLDIGSKTALKEVSIGLGVNTMFGERITTFSTEFQLGRTFSIDTNRTIRNHWKNINLAGGKYFLELALYSHGERIVHREIINSFEVIPSDFYGTGKQPSQWQGRILIKSHWEME